jgi:hypothetical protein
MWEALSAFEWELTRHESRNTLALAVVPEATCLDDARQKLLDSEG